MSVPIHTQQLRYARKTGLKDGTYVFQGNVTPQTGEKVGIDLATARFLQEGV